MDLSYILLLQTIGHYIQWIDRLGTISLLVLILILGARQVWVFGFVYRSKVEECEKWRDVALRSKNLLDVAAQLAEDKQDE